MQNYNILFNGLYKNKLGKTGLKIDFRDFALLEKTGQNLYT